MLTAGVSSAQPVTDLWLRGYSVIPSPRNVQIAGGDIVLDSTWRLEVRESDIAAATLRRDLDEFHSLKLNRAGGGPVIRLAGDRRHRRVCGNRSAGLSSARRRRRD